MAAISAPIDATQTPAWQALQKHYDKMVADGFNLKQAFSEDPDRVQKLSFDT